MATDNTAKACHTLPPVVSSNYTPKGTYTTLAGIKTYQTGPASPTRALVQLYDIFGFASQTLQGADRLAASLNALVLIPDLLRGNVAQAAWFPPDTPEKEAASAKFREGLWKDENLEVLKTFTAAVTEDWESVESWGIVGLCWGAKYAVWASFEKDTPFKASGQVHPAKLAGEDAKKLQNPHILLASNGEPAEEVAVYKEVLVGEGKTSVVEIYPTSHHGWMGARAKLDDAGNLKEYERGYNQLAEFFNKHL